MESVRGGDVELGGVERKDSDRPKKGKVSEEGKLLIERARESLLKFKEGKESLNKLADSVYPLIQSCARGLAYKYSVHEDDLAQETWDRFAKLGAERYNLDADFRSFIIGVSIRVAQELQRQKREVTVSEISNELEAGVFVDQVMINNGKISSGSYEIVDDDIDKRRAIEKINGKLRSGMKIPYAEELSDSLISRMNEMISGNNESNVGKAKVVQSVPFVGTVTTVVPMGGDFNRSEVSFDGSDRVEALNVNGKKAKVRVKGTIFGVNAVIKEKVGKKGDVSVVQAKKKKVVYRTKAHDEMRSIRIELGMQRKEFAQAIGANPYLIDSYEYGRTQEVSTEVLEKARTYRDNAIGKDFELVKMLNSMSIHDIVKMWADKLGLDVKNRSDLARALNKTPTTIKRWEDNLARPPLSYLISTHKDVMLDIGTLAVGNFKRACDEMDQTSSKNGKVAVIQATTFERMIASMLNAIGKVDAAKNEVIEDIYSNLVNYQKGMKAITDSEGRRFYVGELAVFGYVDKAKKKLLSL